MSGAFLLAWRYVARHPRQSLLLVCALGVVLGLPLTVRTLVQAAQEQLRARALATPLVAGPQGSSTDLMLTALHFRKGAGAILKISDCDIIRDTGLAEAIPLHVRFQAQGSPIVGTELDYFEFRGLKLAEGRMLTRLGDCLLGANVARAKNLHAGGGIFSSPEQVFDLAGVYPLKMRVTGVFAPTGTPDDDAIFVDTKTTWLIEGIAHGHDDLANQANAVLSKDAGNVVGNAAVRMFNEVTDANVDSFHFHGDEAGFPIHAMLVLPKDAKSEALLVGRYQQAMAAQLIRPVDVLEVLLSTLFRVEKLVVTALTVVAAAALLVTVLVFGLSFRLRKREFNTLAEIGVGRNVLVLAKVIEIGLIGLAALLIANLGPSLALSMVKGVLKQSMLW